MKHLPLIINHLLGVNSLTSTQQITSWNDIICFDLDGSTVVMSSDYKYGQSNLRITKVKPEHAGTYECKISDGAHSIIKTAILEVLGMESP